MDTIAFTIPQVLSLIGCVQCIYVLVHFLFNCDRGFRYFLAPLLYFFVLGSAFAFDFARSSVLELFEYYDYVSWALWAFGPPLSVILILQISRISSFPPLFSWGAIFLVPIAFLVSLTGAKSVSQDCRETIFCPEMMEWMNVSGLIVGAISLLLIWAKRNVFSDILKQKAGQERYWLILSLIIVNICLLGLVAYGIGGDGFSDTNAVLVRSVLGLSFVYLVSTSLFRIYPTALVQAQQSYRSQEEECLSEDDKALIDKVDSLLTYDKIYHEASYSRSDLARELGVAETIISRVINQHYKKSFPQLLNEYRVEDAKRLLIETDASVKVIAEEVGFNSLPSFNRVFKSFVSQSPGHYRKNTIG